MSLRTPPNGRETSCPAGPGTGSRRPSIFAIVPQPDDAATAARTTSPKTLFIDMSGSPTASHTPFAPKNAGDYDFHPEYRKRNLPKPAGIPTSALASVRRPMPDVLELNARPLIYERPIGSRISDIQEPKRAPIASRDRPRPRIPPLRLSWPAQFTMEISWSSSTVPRAKNSTFTNLLHNLITLHGWRKAVIF